MASGSSFPYKLTLLLLVMQQLHFIYYPIYYSSSFSKFWHSCSSLGSLISQLSFCDYYLSSFDITVTLPSLITLVSVCVCVLSIKHLTS